MSKHILLVHDLAGYGKVSLSAMMPVLSHMGHHLYTLPTALVSNTLDYGKFYIQETTEYMRQSLKVWAELGFSFDVVSTGMILSAEQAALVSDFCEQSAKKGALVFVDPIMGDEGKLYNGVGEETVAHMRKMVAVADCIVPNYTEAAYLADMPYHEDMTEEEKAEALSPIATAFNESSNGHGRLAAYAFMIFNLLCAPCFAAIGAMKREFNNAKWTLAAVGYQCAFAYTIALIVYQLGLLFSGAGFTVATAIAILLLAGLVYLVVRKNPYNDNHLTQKVSA